MREGAGRHWATLQRLPPPLSLAAGAPVPRAEQREAGELRGERQAQGDQRGAVPCAGDDQPGAGAGPGPAEHAAGPSGPAAAGERDVRP